MILDWGGQRMLRVGGRLDASMETHNKRLQSGSELCSVQSCE